ARAEPHCAGSENAERSGLRQTMRRQPGAHLAGQRAARRTAVDADLFGLVGLQELAIDLGDILTRGRESKFRPLPVIDSDHLESADRGDRQRLYHRAGLAALVEAAALQGDQHGPRIDLATP